MVIEKCLNHDLRLKVYTSELALRTIIINVMLAIKKAPDVSGTSY